MARRPEKPSNGDTMVANRLTKSARKSPSTPPQSYLLTGWWADGHYGDNDAATADELSAGDVADYSTEGWKWGDLPLEIDQLSTVEIPDQNGEIVFTVVGDNGSAAVSHPISNVNISRIRMHSGACAGAKSAWLNVVVTFYRAQGGSYTTPNMDASVSDGQGMTTDPPESMFDIVPPALQPPNYYNRAVVNGTIHFRSDAEVYPDPTKLYARVQALPA